jgi:G3E family GTPase
MDTAASLDLTPVTVLTGFLGSGKTTLLNALLHDERLRDTAVIINEFGEVGLDHLLVSEADENVVLLDSGCLCCTIGNGLSETLETLFRQRQDGSVPWFKRVVVETTGLADPFPLLKTVLADYFVSKHFAVNGVLTTADALHGLGQLREHREARNQIAAANHVAITKADVAENSQVEAMQEAITQLNGAASLSLSFAGDARRQVGAEIIDFLTRTPEKDLFTEAALRDDRAHADGHEHNHDDHHHHHDSAEHCGARFHHDERIESFVFKWSRGATWAAYAGWLEQLGTLPASDLMRVKGLLQLDGSGPPYVVQGVQHTFSKPVRMSSWPTADQQSWLVVIARGIRRASLEAIFNPDTAQAEHT